MLQVLWESTKEINTEYVIENTDTSTLARINECLRPQKALEIALGRFLARKIAAKVEGKSLDQIFLCHCENGKPYLKNSDYHLSISHSNGICISVLSDVPVGCDVQSIRKFGKEAVKGFFTNKEYQYICDSDNRDLAMTNLWCIREAMIKLKGENVLKNRVPFIEKDIIEQHYNVNLFISEIDGYSFVIAKEGVDKTDITITKYSDFKDCGEK